MLDEKILAPKYTAAWTDHVTWGDIVSFRFPVLRLSNEDAPCKRRPCLVLDRTERLGEPHLLICYGTTVPADRPSGYDIVADDAADALRFGLHRPTRFVAARRILVPLTHRGFATSRSTSSPVLGSLDGRAYERMNSVRARLHAEADIAAEARRQRRGLRRAKPDGLVVQLRRPMRLPR